MNESPATKALTRLHHSVYGWKDLQGVRDDAAYAQRRWFHRVPVGLWKGICWVIGTSAVGTLIYGQWTAMAICDVAAVGAWIGWVASVKPVDPVVPELNRIGLEQLRAVDAWAHEFVLVRKHVADWMAHGGCLLQRDYDALEAYVGREREAWRRHRVMQALSHAPSSVEGPAGA